jgi:biopolymer transport protein ExbD
MAAKLSGADASRFRVSQNSEINVTPFVDVMLVLLIIFMVAAPVATKSIRLDLPPAAEGPKEEPTIVSIQRSGAVYIGSVETRAGRLAADLHLRFEGRPPAGERVFLRADEEVGYQAFMKVMNALQQGGYRQIALVSEDFSA